MALSEDEQDGVEMMLMICNSLSICGCLFILIIYLSFQELRSFAFRLVQYMSIVDLIHSVALMMPYRESEGWCIFQSFLIQYSALGSALWSLIMAYALYDVVINQNSKIQDRELYFALFGFLVPALSTIPPFITESYGMAQGWCWIKSRKNHFTVDTTLRILLFYGPIWIIFIYMVWAYWKIVKFINQQFKGLGENSESSIKKSLVWRLSLYPWILAVSHIFVTIKRIYDFIDPREEYFPLIIAAGAMISLTGFFNAFAYGLTDSVKSSLKQAWRGGPRGDSFTYQGSQSLSKLPKYESEQ
ncbi:unnamed protein product [Blepharisma stoltei]|uniref:G-protein coupled receptors family 2 profile 2 domain-containing protein n=1 Tax=Blepharisma stoltei TaxID=1481888 RepID=A0AAU9JC91_9CILI|nr:unnamed protein product [Blepharisma stoltei]